MVRVGDARRKCRSRSFPGQRKTRRQQFVSNETVAVLDGIDLDVNAMVPLEQHVHPALEVADHVAILRSGRLVRTSSAVELRANPSAYLGD